MQKILISICSVVVACNVYANTETIQWYVDGNLYDTTTCESDGDIILPTAPTKRGYTFLGWSATTVPLTEYTRLEYIESSGAQYINTGFVPNQDTRVVTEYTTPTNNSDGFIFGARYNQNAGLFTFLYTAAHHIAFGYGAVSTGNTGPATVYGQKLTVDMNKNHCDIYDESGTKLWGGALGTAQFQSSYNLVFPGANSGGTFSPFNGGASRILFYSFKLYDNGTLIHDFIPVLDPNGVACMYDTVSDEYFYNAGTGDFVAGPAI